MSQIHNIGTCLRSNSRLSTLINNALIYFKSIYHNHIYLFIDNKQIKELQQQKLTVAY